jgi:hypothetical protein
MINTYNESSLHEALKLRYAASYSGSTEVPIDGCVADVSAGNLVIEIQTGSFSKLKSKLAVLLESRSVLVVYPVAAEKRIFRIDAVTGVEESSRASPKRGTVWEVFSELIRFPELAARPGFSLEVVLVSVAEFRTDDGKGSWRRKGVSISDRTLLEVLDTKRFESPADYLALLPDTLALPFTAADLAKAAGLRPALAQRAVYCLRKMGALSLAEKRGRAFAYAP